jgi:Multiubiquitin
MANTTGSGQHEKEFTIIVNGRSKKVTSDELSYQAIVNLAFDNNPPTGPNIVITVTYKIEGKQGTLLPGGEVSIKNGAIFNVTATDKS